MTSGNLPDPANRDNPERPGVPALLGVLGGLIQARLTGKPYVPPPGVRISTGGSRDGTAKLGAGGAAPAPARVPWVPIGDAGGGGGAGPYLFNLALFAGTLALSWYEHWVLRDFIWGLWLSSLTVGYALIVYGIYRKVILADGLPLVLRLPGALFLLAFFTFHFGMFHFVHGMFLSTFFPIGTAKMTGIDPLQLLAIIPVVFRTSWPLVLGSALSARGAFQQEAQAFNPMLAYVNVIRMHLLIFVFAFANIAHFTGWPLTAVVLFFYYFPWRHARGQAKLRAARIAM